MLKNENLGDEIRAIIAEQHWKMADLANRVGMHRPNLYRTIDQKAVNDSLIDLMEALGYDVEIRFVRKKNR